MFHHLVSCISLILIWLDADGKNLSCAWFSSPTIQTNSLIIIGPGGYRCCGPIVSGVGGTWVSWFLPFHYFDPTDAWQLLRGRERNLPIVGQLINYWLNYVLCLRKVDHTFRHVLNLSSFLPNYQWTLIFLCNSYCVYPALTVLVWSCVLIVISPLHYYHLFPFRCNFRCPNHIYFSE